MKATRITFVIIFSVSLLMLGYDSLFPRIELASGNSSALDSVSPQLTNEVIADWRVGLIPFIGLSLSALCSWLFIGNRLISFTGSLVGFCFAAYLLNFAFQNQLGYTAAQKLSTLASTQGALEIVWLAIHLMALLAAFFISLSHFRNQRGEQGGAGNPLPAE